MENKIKISRDCRAMMIPSGLEVILAKDNQVQITHRLGGTFTVAGIFGLARIDGKDADALGEPTPQQTTCQTAESVHKQAEETVAAKQATTNESTIETKDLWDAARTVFDPEIPVNIVDLGLVYRMEMFDDQNGKKRVEVDLTLTAPGCAMGPMIAEDLRLRLESLARIASAKVEIVWDPPWHQDMMSEEARMILGLA